ncbi:hypothetical protein MLD38_023998 [Melastoma candidum]|uniref:Uncharacterized protein n=1 Tax=Melastoma candidum TaxID=119954 RepID=A0ACB9NRB4_9MYRT|nr:hypothetical protein MLD38_023998 [Melastoma candidum]
MEAASPFPMFAFPSLPQTILTTGQPSDGRTSPMYVPPLVASTAPSMISSAALLAAAPLNSTSNILAQSAGPPSLGDKVESLTAELSSLKTMMAELLQRQLAATPAPATSQNPHLHPVMAGPQTSTYPFHPNQNTSPNTLPPYNPVMPGSATSTSVAPLSNPYLSGPPLSLPTPQL